MAIILNNNITLPTNYHLSLNGTPVHKVVADGVTVWERVTRLSIENNQIRNYVTIQPDNSVGTSNCGAHDGCPQLHHTIWYCRDGAAKDEMTYIITPNSPYKSMQATFHHAGGLANERDWRSCCINGHEIGENEVYTVEEAPSIEVRFIVGTEGWAEHWKTELFVCMYDVTLMKRTSM